MRYEMSDNARVRIGRRFGRAGILRRLGRAVGAGLALLLLAQGPAGAIETAAKQAILVDFETGAILFEKNADELMPPASMSKLMTVYMVFEKLAAGSLKLDDTLPVSKKAWRMGGSKMFVEVGKRAVVEDLLRGIIVQSGNDACIVVAEGLGGSEAAFAEEMTARAREIGLEQTTFRNATGWPDPEHLTTARDLAKLAQRIISEFPDYYHYYAEKSFTYSKIKQGNRNPLLYKNIGADGLKTGHTEAAGYGLAASALRGERRLVLVVNGLKSVRQRSQESERLLDWGFREFNTYKMFTAGDTVGEADVWLGAVPTVPLVIEDGLTVTLLRKARRKMKVAVVFDEPIPAPITAGAPIARLVISAPETENIEVPLVAGSDIKKLGFLGRIGAAIKYMVWGGARSAAKQ